VQADSSGSGTRQYARSAGNVQYMVARTDPRRLGQLPRKRLEEGRALERQGDAKRDSNEKMKKRYKAALDLFNAAKLIYNELNSTTDINRVELKIQQLQQR
jgi:hypothetical protein